MRLKSRLLMSIGVAWLLFMGIVYLGTDFYLLRNIKSNEKKEINQDLSRVVKSLNQRLNNLSTFTSDWGYWNDAYDFIEGINPKFISENINLLVLANSNINLLLYLNSHGHMLMGISIDPSGKKLMPFPKNIEKYINKDSKLIKKVEAIKSKNGLILVDNNILLVASSAVSNTDKNKPINGVIITGRHLTKDLLKSISTDTGLALELYLVSDTEKNIEIKNIFNLAASNSMQTYIKFENNNIANGFIILRDIKDKAIGVIEAEIPRITYLSGIKAITYYLIMLFILALLFCFLIWYLLNKYILNRIEKLTFKIKEIDAKKDYTSRLVVHQNDEISFLSKHFNELMETILQSKLQLENDIEEMDISKTRLENMNKRLLNEINEQKQIETKLKKLNENLVLASRRAGMAEIANSVLYDIGKILNNIVVNVVDTKTRLEKNKQNSLKLLEIIYKGFKDDFCDHPKAREILQYLEALMKSKEDSDKHIFNEVTSLEKNIEQVKNFIIMQESLSGVAEVNEEVKLKNIINDSILMNKSIYKKSEIIIDKNVEFNDEVIIDRVKLLHILVSLIRGSIQSLLASDRTDKILTIATSKLDDNYFTIIISNNGSAISSENLEKMFSKEYMIVQNEITFNIHTSVIFASDMGGSITVNNTDTDSGNKFIITLPISA